MIDKRTLAALVGVYDFYGRELSEFAVGVWTQALDGVDHPTIEAALRAHICDPKAGQFLPKPADLLRHIRGTTEDAAALAWSQCMDVARAGGNGVHSLCQITRRALDDVGGIRSLQCADERETGFMARRFADAFSVHSRRATAPALLSVGAETKRLA